MASSEVQTGDSPQQLNEGIDGITTHHLVDTGGGGGEMGVVGEMTGDDEGLKVTSVMAHDGGHSLDHASLQDEVRYVTVDESGQAVTIMYPHVNFVEFPGVHGELSLDQGALGGDAGMVLQQDFSGDGPITVVTSDDTGEQLALLDQGHEHSAVAMGGSEGTQAITYLTATDDGPDGSPSAILGEQLIQIPASDQSGSTHTITVPLSFLNDGSGVSILQGLSHLQLPFVGEAGGDSITLSSPMDTDHMASVGSADVTQSQVLSELQSSAVTPTTTQPSVHGQAHGLQTPSHLGIQTSSSKVPLTSSAKPVVVKTNSQSSNKHGSHQPRKLIGSGPTAISAQGVVQKIGNRLVTVLPRPEDLKKLQDSKSLVFSVKGSGDFGQDAHGLKSPRARRVPVPVRPHQRYGRRGRGVGRGRPSSISRIEMKEQGTLTSPTKTVSLLKKDIQEDSILLAETSMDQHLDGCIKLEDTSNEGIVLDMTLPGGSPASAVLVKGPPEDEEFILPDVIVPHIPVTTRRGRRKKRGRGRPRGTYVISSTGRRPGRPRKVETLMEGPHGARMIHTGPDTRLEGDLGDQDTDLQPEGHSIELAGVEGSDGLQEIRVLEMGAMKEEPLDVEIKREEDVDPNKRKLPPRRRGARYEKMMQALKRPEYDDDDDFSMGEEEDISPDYLTYRRPAPAPRPRGTSGPGKRGRPRKHWPVPEGIVKVEPEPTDPQQLITSDLEGTQLDEVTPGDLMSSMVVKSANLMGAEKHNLLITFQKPETGEMVITMLPPPPTSTSSSATALQHHHPEQQQHQHDLHDHTTTEGTQTEEDIGLGTDDVVSVDGHKCEACGEVIPFKRDYIRHLRQKHNLRPFECDQCGKTCTSHVALEAHHKMHGLERPHRCDHCGKGFVDPSHLKTHVLTHTGERPHRCQHCPKTFAQASQLKKHLAIHEEAHQYRCSVCSRTFAHRDTLYTHMKTHTSNRPFICDICSLGFVTSSGLNRHRKVHKRSSDPVGGLEDELKCSVCQANFTFKRTLTKHMSTVHGDRVMVKEEDEAEVKPFQNENSIVEQLQEQLNEGYAPKTSELYDEPKQSETLESKFPTNPFKCGICEESFTDVDVLCDHYTNCHTGEQEVYCDVCSVGCATEQQLEQHKQLHLVEEQQSIIHTMPTEEFPYVCQICGKNFKKHQEWVRHHRVHTQEKNYKCDLCNASFPLKSALDKHVLVHTGERPFKCDICLKSFRQSAALVRHKLWTHRLKNQNKCEICGKTFFTPALLMYHLDSHGDAGQRVKSRLAEVPEGEEQQLLDQNMGQGVEGMEDIRMEDNVRHSCEHCGKNFPSYVALLTHKLSHKLSASYKCDVCHRTFREKRYLQKHKLTHKGVKSWKCDICKKAFATKLTLIRHSHVHLREALRPGPELPFIPEEGEEGSETMGGSTLPSVLKCDECGIDFAHKSHFVRHKLLHSGTPLLKCGLCNRLFVHKSDIIRHKVMHSFMFTCDVCGRNFHKRSLFIMHKKKHVDDKPFKCECGKSFSTSGNYNTHKRIHSGEKPYKCDQCDYRCSQSGRLLKHKRMHSGEKPFQCNTCGKYFANAESVKIHMRIHTGERPFKCGNCGKTFINNSSLNQHMRDHIREEMFKCDMCSHKFRREHHLAKHRQIHHLRPQYSNTGMGLEADGNVEAHLYMCEICGRVFDKKKYLYTHHNVHSRQRNFPCNVCGKQLASRLALKNHNLIHTGQMPFKCPLCDKEFRSSSNQKRHTRTHTTQDVLRCDVCDETFYSTDLLSQHKATHMQGMMMMNPGVEGVTSTDNSHHLYVFETVGEVGEAMDSTQQLLVDNNQQQFLVDGSQPLLVFPETANTPYSELAEAPDPEPEQPDPEHQPQPEVIMVQEKMDEHEEEERIVEKPFRCDDCGKSFAKKQYLTKHKYRHREVKPHACDVCGKRFAQKFEVAVHKIKHTGERRFQCDVCCKPFRSKVNLLNHKMRHTGEYPFLCSVCRKGFSTQLQLERHVTLHTGSHPYKCSICQRGYTQRINLVKHLAKTHDIVDASQIEAMNSMENAEAVENMEGMETMEGVEEMDGSMLSGVQEAGMDGTGHQAGVEETEHVAIAMDPDLLRADVPQAAYSVVEVHPEGLKEYLLAGPQVVSTHDMDPKLLQSILQQVRAAPDDSHITTIADSQAVVHVTAMDE
ncbi:zinc finger protein Xfin [Penaeus vannamei]|uniref:zinc finger protein Xfin n=1 Tax=Penaeus vannamei TaxID=6689 RepID=UPI00387F5C0F